MAISKLLELGKQSLATYQTAINITGENIANANVEGYSRQRVDLGDLRIGNKRIGTILGGVEASSVKRIRERLLDAQYWREKQNLGKFETNVRALHQIETFLADDSEGGLTASLQAFWQAWGDLANDPESATARNLVRDKAISLASAFNSADGHLQSTRHHLGTEIRSEIRRVNKLSGHLADINKQMLAGQTPELLDQRDRIIDELSQYIAIEAREEDNGTMSVTTGGIVLVSGEEVNELKVSLVDSESGSQAVISFKEFDYQPQILSGEINALMEVVNETIPGITAQLDQLADAIVSGVNGVHSGGYNLDGITGINFFDTSSTGASGIRLATEIIQDPSLIASRSGSSGVGNNDIALAINDLQNQVMVDGLAPAAFLDNLLGDIGSQLQEAMLQENSQRLITEKLENEREAIAGVSLDEEMTKLLQYEQSYEAAARLVQTVDEMMETVISLV